MVKDVEVRKRERLGDLIKVVHGWPFKSTLYSEERTGRPIVVSIGNFSYSGGFRFDSTTVKEYAGDYPKEYELKPNDVLLIMTCQTAGGEILGIPGRIPDDGHTYLHNQRMGKVVFKDTDVLHPDYFYYLALSREFNQALCGSASGSKILHTSPGRIEAFEFDLPSLIEQRTAARILRALDDKIELNRRMNATLEAIARAVFKEWFVDGVKEEWGEKPLRELFAISKTSVNPGASPEEVFDHYSIPAFDEGRVPKQELGNTIKSNKFIVLQGCILISKLNPRFPRVWLPVLDGERQAITSTEFIVCVPSSVELREFIYGLYTSQAFASEFNNMATGSTGSHQRVRPESMLNMTTAMPDQSTIKAYSTLIRPMLERINANTTESLTLAALRDTLLPKLMRGEVRVKQTLQANG